MVTESRSTIFMMFHSEYSELFQRLAKMLRADYGHRIIVFVSSSDKAAPVRDMNFADEVHVEYSYKDNYHAPIDDTEIAEITRKARHYEEMLGRRIIEFAPNDRDFGAGYAVGAACQPFTEIGRKIDPAKTLRAYVKLLDFYNDIFQKYRPKLFMMASGAGAALARHYEVPLRNILLARTGTLYYWTDNVVGGSKITRDAVAARAQAIDRAFAKPDSMSPDTHQQQTPYISHTVARDKVLARCNPLNTLKATAWLALRWVSWRLRGLKKGKGQFWGLTTYFWREWRNHAYLARIAKPSADISNRFRFVFYPLHMEPETSLQIFSPEYMYQLELVSRVSLALPADTVLLVKEHVTATARRHWKFYEQLTRFPNVVFVDPVERGVDLIQKSHGVITITGTAGYEACFLGKPVISFGRHNFFNVLPTVQVAKDLDDLPNMIERLLAMPAENPALGIWFREGLLEHAFDLGAYIPGQGGSLSESALKSCYAAMLEGLDP